jgi:pimeloyl-ACP methyl ester carboxylesterase
MPLIQLPGFSVHIREQGQGPPVVMVHSSGLSSEQWQKLSERLAGRFRAIAPDLIHYGSTGGFSPDRPFHFSEDVDVVEAVLSYANAPVHLVGHSYGGMLALRAALRRPHAVVSLSLFDPIAFGVLRSTGDEAGLLDLGQVNASGTFFDDAAATSVGWVEQLVDYWNGAGAWKRLPPAQQQAFARSGPKTFHEVRTSVFDETPHTAYAALSQPVLLMSGSRTPIAAQRVVAILAEQMPHARLEVLGGVGHMAPVSRADRVNDLIVSHIEACESARRDGAGAPM